MLFNLKILLTWTGPRPEVDPSLERKTILPLSAWEHQKWILRQKLHLGMLCWDQTRSILVDKALC